MFFKYCLAWPGMMLLAITNGGLRDLLYQSRLGELAAHQLSTVLLLLLLAGYFRMLAIRWPLSSASQAWTVGVAWLVLTLSFEFGFGHYIAGHSWNRLWAEYNLLAGRVWLLIPLWVLVGPALFRRLTVR